MATREELEEQLADAYAARRAILTGGQQKGIRGKTLTQASLDAVNATIKTLEAQIARINRRPSHTYIRRVRG